MTALNLVAMSLSLLSASLCLWALSMVWRLSKRLQTMLRERSTRSLRQLDAEVAELTSAQQSLFTTVKKLAARTGMQDLRARRRTESEDYNDPNLPPEERKARLRAAMADGKVTILRDGQQVRE